MRNARDHRRTQLLGFEGKMNELRGVLWMCVVRPVCHVERPPPPDDYAGTDAAGDEPECCAVCGAGLLLPHRTAAGYHSRWAAALFGVCLFDEARKTWNLRQEKTHCRPLPTVSWGTQQPKMRKSAREAERKRDILYAMTILMICDRSTWVVR